MKTFNIIILVIFLISILGCNQKEERIQEINFQSEKYGFSFSFPDAWEKIEKDLPEKWAIVNNGNTILFTVNDIEVKSLLALGKIQALRDFFPEEENVQEKVEEINNIVKIVKFNDIEWYTYALSFPDKGVNSIVSGTLCDEKEINLVLVSKIDTFEKDKNIYSYILNSFKC